jgi:hypothetical protein
MYNFDEEVAKIFGLDLDETDLVKVRLKDSLKINKNILGTVLTKNIGGLVMVGIWVKEDSFEVIDDEGLEDYQFLSDEEIEKFL